MKDIVRHGAAVMIAAVLLFALFYLVRAYSGLTTYYFTTDETIAERVEWRIAEGSWGRYYLEGEYRFQWEGKEYSGSTIMREPVFLNRKSAEEWTRKLSKDAPAIFFDKSHPERSTLERKIPMKEIVSAALLLISVGYLFALRKKTVNPV